MALRKQRLGTPRCDVMHVLSREKAGAGDWKRSVMHGVAETSDGLFVPFRLSSQKHLSSDLENPFVFLLCLYL